MNKECKIYLDPDINFYCCSTHDLLLVSQRTYKEACENPGYIDLEEIKKLCPSKNKEMNGVTFLDISDKRKK